MIVDIYKFANQNKLRFPSKRGELFTEHLFELPLKAANGFDLNSIAINIHRSLKETGEESFVEDTTSDPARERLTVALEVVKDVIKTKQEENKARMDRLKRIEERKKILDAMAAKKDQQLSQASLEELEQKLAALD